MDKKNFHITPDGNLLTISSEKQTNLEQEKGNYNRKEFGYQSFQRSFELPKSAVDEEGIAVRYDNDVLRMVIPKKEEAEKQAPKTIEVR
jgi:HSP20 family protein